MASVLRSPARDLPAPSRRRLRRLTLARFITELGTRSAFVALVLRASELSESATGVSVALAVTVAADALITPLAGMAGDAWNRRAVMIISDLLAAVCYLALVGIDGLVGLVVLASVAVAVEAFYFPSAGAALPNLFDRESLGVVNATISQARLAGTILGPALAGAAVAVVDTRWLFALNALTFAVSALLVSTVRGEFQAAREPATPHKPAAHLREFVGLLRSHPAVLSFMALWTVTQLGAGLLWVGLPGMAAQLGSRVLGYPGLLTVGAVGSFLGAVVASRLLGHRSTRTVLLSGLAFQGVWLLGTAAAPVVVVAALTFALFRVGEACSGTSAFALLQGSTPDSIRARASAWVDSATIAAFGIGVTAGGPVVDHLGPRACFVLAGAGALAGLLLAGRLVRAEQPGRPRAADLV